MADLIKNERTPYLGVSTALGKIGRKTLTTKKGGRKERDVGDRGSVPGNRRLME